MGKRFSLPDNPSYDFNLQLKNHDVDNETSAPKELKRFSLPDNPSYYNLQLKNLDVDNETSAPKEKINEMLIKRISAVKEPSLKEIIRTESEHTIEEKDCKVQETAENSIKKSFYINL
jgi:hypothetical protein